jgi:hypothetical protein
MLGLIKKLFGAKPVETVVEVPYKVEAAAAPVVEATPAFPVEAKPAKATKAKKPAVKKATTRKPRAPKAPK